MWSKGFEKNREALPRDELTRDVNKGGLEMLINFLAIATFVVGVPAICWGIWNEEKLIAFEQKLFKRWTRNER